MNWDQARKLLGFARKRIQTQSAFENVLVAPRNGAGAPRARSLCIVSGKGGTGKSVITAALSAHLCRMGRVLLVDADLGVGNAHILQGVSPKKTFVDVVEGRSGVRDVVTRCGNNIDLIAGGSGVSRMAGLSTYELHLIACGLEELEYEYSYLLVDSAAGISDQTVSLAGACDQVLIVTTPDLTAMTDAYAFLKVLLSRKPHFKPLLLINRCFDEAEGLRTAERIGNVCERFLGRAPELLGWLPEDKSVRRSVNRRLSVLELEEGSPISAAMPGIVQRLQLELDAQHGGGMGQRLLGEYGFSAKLA